MKHGTLIFLLALLLALSTRAAQAQPAGAQAETLFREGKDLMVKGKIAEACAAFDASQKLEPAISTLLNQAACREKNDQLATAWGLFLEAERETRAAPDAATQQLHQVAQSKQAKLEPRLSTLTITVPPENRVGGLQITRAGEPVDPGAWNKALPVDGGTYRIAATAPGNAEWSSTITVGSEHDAKAIEIPRLKAAALEPPHAKAPPPTVPADRAAPDEPTPGPSRLVPFVLGGAAIALAGGAVGFELWGQSAYSSAKTEVDNDKQTSLWHSANTRRYVAEGLGVAAVASAGVAVWLYLRTGSSEAAPPGHASRMQLAPIVAGDRAGLLMIGRY